MEDQEETFLGRDNVAETRGCILVSIGQDEGLEKISNKGEKMCEKTSIFGH